MQLPTIFTAIAALAIVSVQALPEAIPALLETRDQCIHGIHKVGSGCPPGQRGKTSCSADHKYVVSRQRTHIIIPLSFHRSAFPSTSRDPDARSHRRCSSPVSPLGLHYISIV